MSKIGDFLRGMKAFSVWRRQVKNWRVVSIRSMFNRFFQRLTQSYNNIYIRQLGANPIQLGIVNSFARISGAIISIPVGLLQDRYSLKKIFLIGVGIQLLVRGLYASATGWMMIIPAMFLSTLGMRTGGCGTICFVALKRKDRSICRGICDGFFATPSLIAPTIAALIITFYGGISVEGIRPIYILQLVANLVLFVFLITQLTEIVRENVVKPKSNIIEDLREVFKRGTALKRYTAFFAAQQLAMAMITPFRYPFANEIKLAGPLLIGAMVTAGLVIQSFGSIPLANIVGKIGRKKTVYLLEPLYWASTLILIFAPSPNFLILSAILQGFRSIAGFICVTPIMIELVPIDCIGRWRGIINLFGGLIAIPAPIIGGIIWERFGPSYVFLIALAIDVFIRLPLFTTIPHQAGDLQAAEKKQSEEA